MKGLLTDFQDINDALRNSFVRVTQAGYEKGNGKRATEADIDINIDMAAYQQTKFEKMQTPMGLIYGY